MDVRTATECTTHSHSQHKYHSHAHVNELFKRSSCKIIIDLTANDNPKGA